MQMAYDPAWYIMYTKPMLEKKIIHCLDKKKIINYCPCKKLKKQSFNRTTIIQKPLIPRYIFVHTHADRIPQLIRIPGVINIVYRFHDPAVIPNEEIKGIKNFLERHENILIEKAPISTMPMLPSTEGHEVQQEGLNYVAKLKLPSLGWILKASIPFESIKSSDVIVISDKISAFTTKVAN
jgi:transcription antitermination factor NusG